jgi:RNA polymerase sigma-70 factor (ECF subfamily)
VTIGGDGSPAQDRAGFTAIVQEHWDAGYRFLYSLTGSSHETEDLTQETFLRALKRLDSFQSGTNLRSWLLRIAANACFDLRRKQKRVVFQSLNWEVPTTTRLPGQRLELGEQCEILRVALEELSELTRMVFHLRATEELSFREIAALADITEEAARWHMHRARTKLLKRLSDKAT